MFFQTEYDSQDEQSNNRFFLHKYYKGHVAWTM